MTACARRVEGRGPGRLFGALGRAAPAALMLLAACGDGSGNQVYRQAGATLTGEVLGLLGGQAEAPPAEITQAQIDEIPFATILVGRPDTAARSALFAAASNGGYVTYLNSARQSVTLRGGQVTATHGLIADLAAYRSDPQADPVVTRRPPTQWPAEVVRVYRDRDASGRLFSRTMICRPVVQGPEPLRILEQDFDVVRIEEPCASPTRTIVNRYWVEPATGFVRKSEQWAGLSGPLVVEVVRRVAGDD